MYDTEVDYVVSYDQIRGLLIDLDINPAQIFILRIRIFSLPH